MQLGKVEDEFRCQECGTVATTAPVLAEDGFIYHKGCAKSCLSFKGGRTTFKSPVTGQVKGGTLISSKTIEWSIKLLQQNKSTSEQDEEVADIIMKAKLGEVQCMGTLGRWLLFGERSGVDIDVKSGFEWISRAHGENNLEATAYYGHCLIRGLGTEKSKEDGFEALCDAASGGSGDGKDFAAWTLGFCYQKGLHGFKQDAKKATKWMNKVANKPDVSVQKKIWDGYDLFSDEDGSQSINTLERPTPSTCGDVGKNMLFNYDYSATTATTISTKDHTSDSNVPLMGVDLLSTTKAQCEQCSNYFERKDLFGSTCQNCALNDFKSFSYLPSGLDD